jgi:hypothetical protein
MPRRWTMDNVRTVAVVNEINHGEREVDGVTYTIKELVWTDGGRSFEVWKGDVDLTFNESFDAFPTDMDIRKLVRNEPTDVTITESCIIRPNPHPIGRKEQPCEIRVGPYPTMSDGAYSAPLFMDDVRRLRDSLSMILGDMWGIYNRLDQSEPYLCTSTDGRLSLYASEEAAERAITEKFNNDRERYVAAPFGIRT